MNRFIEISKLAAFILILLSLLAAVTYFISLRLFMVLIFIIPVIELHFFVLLICICINVYYTKRVWKRLYNKDIYDRIISLWLLQLLLLPSVLAPAYTVLAIFNNF